MPNYLRLPIKWCVSLIVLSIFLIASNLLAQNANAEVKILDTQVTYPVLQVHK